MIVQSILDTMELLNRELQLQSGEEDVTRGTLAVNLAIRHFESLAAQRPNIKGSSTTTFQTTTNTEVTAFPSNFIRIDRLQLIDTSLSPNLPKWDLIPIKRTGGHRPSTSWFWSLAHGSSVATGEPRRYWTNGFQVFWDPIPDAQYTLRVYGFAHVGDYAAASTFGYDDLVALPVAIFANRLLKVGLDDDAADMTSLGEQVFKPVLDALAGHSRDGAQPLEYTEVHFT